MLPGTDFGRAPEELYLRLAYVDFDGGEAMKLVGKCMGPNPEASQVEEFVQTACPQVALGIDRVCRWMTDLQARHHAVDTHYS